MTLTILSRSQRLNQDVTDVRVKTDDWEGTLAISGEEAMQAGSLEAAIEAKLAPPPTRTVLTGMTDWQTVPFVVSDETVAKVNKQHGDTFTLKRIDKIAKY